MTTGEGLVRKRAALLNALENAKKRKVKIKVIAPETKENKDAIEELKNVCEFKSKNHDGRFILVDGKHAILMLSHDKNIHPSHEIAVWISSPYAAGNLQKIFESYWK